MIPINEIKMYLGTGLNVMYKNQNITIDHMLLSEIISEQYIPKVRPLSQIIEKIEYNRENIFPIEYLTPYLEKHNEVLSKPANSVLDLFKPLISNYEVFNILVDMNFDVFGWLEKGLAEELK